MKFSDIPQLRLKNQGILDAPFKSVKEVVKHLGAVQAQDYGASLWAIGLRMAGSPKPTDIEKAVQKKEIVRMWPMRGTIHWVPAEDARWMLELMKPRIISAYKRRHAFHGVVEAELETSRKAIAKALKGGKQMTRPQLYEVLEKTGIKTAESRGLHILGRMAHDPLICFGPRQGNLPTFVLFDEWLPKSKNLSRDEALAVLTLRYFTSHGPATIQDMVWWSFLAGRDIKIGIEKNKGKLVSEVIEGKTYYMPVSKSRGSVKDTAYLLPAFDEYIVGYKDRSAVLEDAHKHKVNPGANGVLQPVVVINGQVVGNWKKEIRKGQVVVTPKPFTSFSKSDEKLIVSGADVYRNFLR